MLGEAFATCVCQQRTVMVERHRQAEQRLEQAVDMRRGNAGLLQHDDIFFAAPSPSPQRRLGSQERRAAIAFARNRATRSLASTPSARIEARVGEPARLARRAPLASVSNAWWW